MIRRRAFTRVLLLPCPACRGGGELRAELEIEPGEPRSYWSPGSAPTISLLSVSDRTCSCSLSATAIELAAEDAVMDGALER